MGLTGRLANCLTVCTGGRRSVGVLVRAGGRRKRLTAVGRGGAILALTALTCAVSAGGALSVAALLDLGGGLLNCGGALVVSAEQLDLPARILAVVDAFDAMTSDRVYRKGRQVDDALAELRTLPHLYDAAVIAALDALHQDGTIDEIIRLDREGKLTGELHV